MIKIDYDAARDAYIVTDTVTNTKTMIEGNHLYKKYSYMDTQLVVNDLFEQRDIGVSATQQSEKIFLDNAKKIIVEKIRTKYGNEKFIMIKPEDLINFILSD